MKSSTCVYPQATTKLSGNRVRRRDASDESDADSDTSPQKKKAKKGSGKGKSHNARKEDSKPEPKRWSEQTEKLKALVISLQKGLPAAASFKLPPSVYLYLFLLCTCVCVCACACACACVSVCMWFASVYIC